jgi:hypothetical protein
MSAHMSIALRVSRPYRTMPPVAAGYSRRGMSIAGLADRVWPTWNINNVVKRPDLLLGCSGASQMWWRSRS